MMPSSLHSTMINTMLGFEGVRLRFSRLFGLLVDSFTHVILQQMATAYSAAYEMFKTIQNIQTAFPCVRTNVQEFGIGLGLNIVFLLMYLAVWKIDV